MAVPTQLSDLSATAASNSPAGGDTVGTTMDDYLRAIQSIIVRISAGTDAMATPNIGAATGTSLVLSGLATVNGAFTSLGLDDNATAKALTLSGSGANSITIANSATNPTIGTSAGAVSFNPAGQGETLRVTTGGASTVNYFSLSGAQTGGRLTLLATGSDTNVGASWQTKGSGSHLFVTETGASAQVEIQHTASADRYITLTGSNGGNPTIGTSAGNLVFAPAGLRAVSVEAPASTVNYLSLSGAATGGACVIRPNSDVDTNIGLTLDSKGSGQITFRTDPYGTPAIQAAVQHTASANRYITLTGSSGGNPTIGTSGGGLSLSPAGLPGLIVNAVASAVNYAVINQAAAGSAVSFVANGSDVDIPLYISSKGAQNVGVYTGGLSLPQVFVTHTASADRYLTLTGSNGGNPTIGTSAGALQLSPNAGIVGIAGGSLTVNSNLNINCTGASGAGIALTGNGATTPSKYLRAINGVFEIVNDGFTSAVMRVTDTGVVTATVGTATTAGGTQAIGLGSTATLGIYYGSGAPTVSAAKGSLYLRSDGTTTNNRMYVNTDGGTTWTAVTTAA